MIPESLHIGFKEYFEILLDKKYDWDKDRGLLEKLKRKIDNETASERVSKKDVNFVYKLVKNELTKEDAFENPLIQEWLSFKISSKFPDLLQTLIQTETPYTLSSIAKDVLPQAHWAGHPELIQQLIEKGDHLVLLEVTEHILSQSHWAGHPELIQQLIGKESRYVLLAIVKYVFSQPHSVEYFELLRQVIEKGSNDVLNDIKRYVFPQDHWKKNPEFSQLKKLLRKKRQALLKKKRLNSCDGAF